MVLRNRVPPRAAALLALLVGLLVYFYGSTASSNISSAVPTFFGRSTYMHRRDPPVLGCPAEEASSDTWLTLQKVKTRACFLLLARDKDLEDLKATLANVEDTFNAKFRYPYVFLNEAPYSQEFEQGIRQALPPGAEVEFGVIPEEHWSIPSWLDKDKVREGLKKMGAEGVQYADRESYHHMCRYYSGLFALHPLLQKYDFYWRLEPGVRFYCELQYDPFLFMAQHRKVYGWVITIVETPNTIPTLFQNILEWRELAEKASSGLAKFGSPLKLVDYRKKGTLWDFFLKEPDNTLRGQRTAAEEYNLCHFWTNFEIGDLRFFRGKEYQSLFQHLDRTGGFYLERWGDAPIRSLAVGLLAGFEKVHYFEDIAYKHDWFLHKPHTKEVGCKCKPEPFAEWVQDVDNNGWYSCLPRWKALDTMR